MIFLSFISLSSFSQIRINQNNQTIIGSSWNGWNPTHNTFVHKEIYFDCVPAVAGLYFENYYNNVDPNCVPIPCSQYYNDPIIRPQFGNSLWLGKASSPLLTVYSAWFFALNNNQYATYSDARLKSNITPMSEVLSILMKLEPVVYDMTFDEVFENIQEEKLKAINDGGKNSVGLIAQEVREILPKLVTETDNGYLAVSYTGLIPYLLKAIQEQQKEIEELKTKIAALD